MLKILRNRKGQSILEYVIVWTGIVTAILVAAYPTIQPAVEKTLQSAAGVIEKAAEEFSKIRVKIDTGR